MCSVRSSARSLCSSTSSSARVAEPLLVLGLLASAAWSCAGTRVAFVGDVDSADAAAGGRARLLTTLEGTLSVGRIFERSKIELDPRFPEVGFQGVAHPLVVVPGGDTVLMLSDDPKTPNACLYVALADGEIAAKKVFGDGEFIPYLDLHLSVVGNDEEPHVFGAVCKGGRGRIAIEEASENGIKGTITLAVTCRTYIDGYEREEEDLRLAGPFDLPRSARSGSGN
jgi:hypothetical protein